MYVKIVLQNITWKENANQKVGDNVNCAKFWMNVGTEAKNVWKSSIFRNCVHEWDKNCELHTKCVIPARSAIDQLSTTVGGF